jgi:hypothetical protein
MEARPPSVGRAMRPTTGEIVSRFPRYFLYVEWIAYTMQYGLSTRSGDLRPRGNVFTHSPSLWNPYVI